MAESGQAPVQSVCLSCIAVATDGRPGHGWQLYTTHLGMKGDNSPSSPILRIFIGAWKLPRLLVCFLPPGGLTIPPFMRKQDSIRERQLELFKLYIFFFPSLHLPSFLLIQLMKSDQGCSEFSAQSFSLSNCESLCFQRSGPGFGDRAQPSLFAS